MHVYLWYLLSLLAVNFGRVQPEKNQVLGLLKIALRGPSPLSRDYIQA